ncbi:MAG: hypothetical protein KBS95_08840 [Alistipes sp.]|nr:hypothetical protein [Candidatus Alistipes equi]
MKKIVLSIVAILLSATVSAVVPYKFNVPDVPGYVTLKGDFHCHTVFSDGAVWPTTRIEEMVFDNMDILAITDHCDTRHRKQVRAGLFVDEKCTRNTSYEIASKHGKRKGIIVLHGAEVTRGSRLFPGHFNTHFVSDGDLIAKAMEAEDATIKDKKKREETAIINGLKEARRQGAFITWNHPNWEPQAPNGVEWLPIHEKVYKEGYIDGIEIVNMYVGFCPEAFHWAIEKGLTVVSGTDSHSAMNTIVDYVSGEHRAMTLVFSKSRKQADIREALNNHRTAVVYQDNVYGPEDVLRPFLKEVIKIEKISYHKNKVNFYVKNVSSIPVVLKKSAENHNLVITSPTINPGAELVLGVTAAYGAKKFEKNDFEIKYSVENFYTDTDKPLQISVPVSLPEKYR